MNTQVISRMVVESFNNDIQKYLENIINKSSETDYGVSFKQWANENKLIFEIIIRALSLFIQEKKLSIDIQNPINSLLVYQLDRLPREIRRIFMEDADEIANNNVINNDDENFRKEFELAIEDLQPDELRLISKLDNKRIKEFVNSPKRLRPFLLEKWNKISTSNTGEEISKKLSSGIDSLGSFFDSRKPKTTTINNSAQIINRGFINSFKDLVLRQGAYCNVITPVVEIETKHGIMQIPTNTITQLRTIGKTTEIATTNGNFRGKLITRYLTVNFNDGVSFTGEGIDLLKIDSIEGYLPPTK